MKFLAIPRRVSFCYVTLRLGEYLIGFAPHTVGLWVAIATARFICGNRFRQL